MIACPTCRAENPEGFKFCGQCAAPLVASPAHPEERKTVTTLFCDLVAFTAMSEAADPEDVDAVLREYFARATKVIESHGGTVEKFIGDAVVGVFGVPAVHEDDPERAVRAGLRIVEALEGMKRPDGSPLEVRVGVNTGEALVRLDVDPASGRGFLTGDAVNVAARLQAAAPPGGVVVGALVHELTKHAARYKELEPLTVKGKKEPVRAWLAEEATEIRSRTGLRTTGKLDTPFLGRDAEERALAAALQTAISSGQAQFTLAVGEPGIGKSRLVLEFARSLDERPEFFTWRQGRCSAYGDNSGFAALTEILKAHAAILDSDEVATVEEKLEAVLPEGDQRSWLRQRLRPLLGLDAAPASQEESFAAWTQFLRHLASSGPTILVLEDLHWAGDGLLAFVEHLVAQELEVPLLLLATARPELLTGHPGTLAPSTGVSRLTLAPLSQREAGRLISALLDERLAADLRRPVLGRVGGNPLYAEEYVRLLLDRGLLLKTKGVLQLKEGEELPLPDTVQAVLTARLDTLPPAHKALLCDAAVFGETFWAGGVAALGGRDTKEVRSIMDSLATRQLVRPVNRSALARQSEYLFWHALARDVAYEELPRKVRAHKHIAAADWFEAEAGERVEEFAEVLAHHYTTALDLARAAGESDLAAQLEGSSLRFLTLAGDRAFNLDVHAAERFYAAALELSAADGPERARLDLKFGEAALWGGRSAEAAEALRRAVEALRAAGDVRSAAVALVRLARTRHNLAAAPQEVEGLYREAVALLGDDGPSDARVTVLTEWGRELKNVMELDTALATFKRALEVAHELGAPEPALALGLSGSVRIAQGDLGFVDDYRRALDAAEAQGLGIDRARIWGNYAVEISLVEGPRRSLEEFARLLDFDVSRGLVSWLVGDRADRVMILVCAGDWDEALREAAAVELDFSESAANTADLLIMRLLTSLPLVWRGADADARRGLSPALDTARRSPVAWDVCWGLTFAAIATAPHDRDRARGLLREMVLTAPSDDDPWLFCVLPEAVRVALRCGDAELAEHISSLVRGELPAVQIALASVAALCAEAHGQFEAAAGGFAAAAARWREFGVPFEEAQALLGQGRCLLALGRAQEAEPPLTAAREIFVRLGAKPALAEVDRLLDDVSAAPR